MGRKECSLCRAQTHSLCVQRVLNKYDVEYFRCPQCDLIQTEPPYWLGEVPWSSISHLDTGAVMRNSLCARVTTATGHVVDLDAASRCLDYGGGYGLFVRMMRDQGFDFYWWDKYCLNIFSKGFEGEPSSTYDLVTCFELFEHLPDVREELDPLFRGGHELVLVGTLLHTGHKEGWWYYCPELGGHVSFYSERTMQFVGEQWGYRALCSPQYTLFLRQGSALSKRRESLLRRILEESQVASMLLAFGPRYESLVEHDHARLLEEYSSEAESKGFGCQPVAAGRGQAETRRVSRWQRTRKVLAVALAEAADMLVRPTCERALGRGCAGARRSVLAAGRRAVAIVDWAESKFAG